MVTWKDVPVDRLVVLLGDDGCSLDPRDIWSPDGLASRFGIPLELLPVSELLENVHPDACRDRVVLYREGRRVAAMQGVIAGDLIDAIAKGLGVWMPQDAPAGYSGSRRALAAAVVRQLLQAQ